MKKKTIITICIFVLILLVGIIFYYFAQPREVTQTLNNSVKKILNASCTNDKNCSVGEFCAFGVGRPYTTGVGACQPISSKEGKECSSNVDCDYGYSCTKGFFLRSINKSLKKIHACIRNQNPHVIY